MCSSHHTGIFALGVIHLTTAILLAVVQGSITIYFELFKPPIARYIIISPGFWLTFVLALTGGFCIKLGKSSTPVNWVSRFLCFLCVLSLLVALSVIAIGGRYLSDYKVWMWRKQRYTNDPNPLPDANFILYHQLLRNRIDIEALFILGACLVGLAVFEIISLILTIGLLSKFLCSCCSEKTFGIEPVVKFQPRTTTRIVKHMSRENSRVSLPLLVTDL